MRATEIEQVLANWIEQASSPIGQLPEGMTPAKWITANFLRWWRTTVDESLGDAESAAAAIRTELMVGGGSREFGEALHECTHLEEALAELRQTLLPDGDNEQLP